MEGGNPALRLTDLHRVVPLNGIESEKRQYAQKSVCVSKTGSVEHRNGTTTSSEGQSMGKGLVRPKIQRNTATSV